MMVGWGVWAWRLCLVAVLGVMVQVWNMFWVRPMRLTKQLKAQGFNGPPYKLLGMGNGIQFVKLMHKARSINMPLSHDILHVALPHYALWSKIYGRKLLVWLGPDPALFIDEPATVREILLNKCGNFSLMPLPDAVRGVLGNGLLTLDGDAWAYHRKIINPAFSLENLKEMLSSINETANEFVERWSIQLDGEGKLEVEAYKEFKQYTAQIIGTTAFGSNPEQVKHVINMLDEQVALVLADYSFIPGYRFLPTKTARRRATLEREIRKCMRRMIEERRIKGKKAEDLLGFMMEANFAENASRSLSDEEIIHECKSFFLAGHETTAGLLAWTCMLLATNQQWQDRARAQVLDLLGSNQLPTWTIINKLKIIGSIFNESLRLYPPVVLLVRKAIRNCNVGNIAIPEGALVWIPVLAMNLDKTVWGEDAHEFNPGRFLEGDAKTTKPYMPFSHGPRTCIGQNLALLEYKVLLSMILQRFSIHLSPYYTHSPVSFLTLYPQHGIPIILHAI